MPENNLKFNNPNPLTSRTKRARCIAMAALGSRSLESAEVRMAELVILVECTPYCPRTETDDKPSFFLQGTGGRLTQDLSHALTFKDAEAVEKYLKRRPIDERYQIVELREVATVVYMPDRGIKFDLRSARRKESGKKFDPSKYIKTRAVFFAAANDEGKYATEKQAAQVLVNDYTGFVKEAQEDLATVKRILGRYLRRKS